jgi:excisionase family DNA binding protein
MTTAPLQPISYDMDSHDEAPPVRDVSPRVLLTVEAAADLLSISRTMMFALIKTGEIVSVRVGRLRRIPAGALDSYARRLVTEQSAA